MLVKALEERESLSSTVLDSFVAVPHLVLPGHKRFLLVFVRARGGVFFSDSAPGVEALFFLFGTRDNRPLHLRVLAALARIVLTRGFREAWHGAKGSEHLRDLILMGERERFRQEF